ncbi:MAG: right-handed parallel beta-helix repeat-containing protein [Candidatus Hermodarchaeota archaeon]
MKKNILIVLLAVFLLLTIFQGRTANATPGFKKDASALQIREDISSLPYQSHSPSSTKTPHQVIIPNDCIYINHTDNFTQQGFTNPGNSTYPYKIAGLEITNFSCVLIYIENIAVPFIIYDMVLDGINNTNNGIVLKNSPDAEIKNVEISNCKDGIVLTNSDNVTIKNCYIHHNEDPATKQCGLLVGGGRGVFINESNYVKTTNSDITDNDEGVTVDSSDNSSKRMVGGSSNNLVRDSKLLRNRNGVVICSGCSDNTVQGNTISDNSIYGVVCRTGSSNNIVRDNCFYGNGNGSSQQASDSGTSNTFESNFWSDWSSGVYSIDGTVSNTDASPLSICPVTVPGMTIPIVISSLLIIVIFVKVRSKRRNSKKT